MQTYIFDIDGTISIGGMPIHTSIADKIHALTHNHQVIFSSARPIRDMLPMLPQKLHHCLMVGCNGGMAWQNGNFLFSHQFENAKVSVFVGSKEVFPHATHYCETDGIPALLSTIRIASI